MAFCKLPDGQKAALLFVESIVATPADQKLALLKKAVVSKNYQLLAVIASLMGGTAPTESDFQFVCSLTDGLRSAYFLLACIDVKGTDDAKSKMIQAFETHCYDKIAAALVSNLTTPGITFTGDELRQAYDPTDQATCQGEPAILLAIGTLISTGELVGNFFSQSLPDFFAHDFSNFFTGTLSTFFTGDVATFFSNFAGSFKDGFEGLGASLEDSFNQLGNSLKVLNPVDWGSKLDPTSW